MASSCRLACKGAHPREPRGFRCYASNCVHTRGDMLSPTATGQREACARDAGHRREIDRLQPRGRFETGDKTVSKVVPRAARNDGRSRRRVRTAQTRGGRVNGEMPTTCSVFPYLIRRCRWSIICIFLWDPADPEKPRVDREKSIRFILLGNAVLLLSCHTPHTKLPD